jgi:hypothetical protein
MDGLLELIGTLFGIFLFYLIVDWICVKFLKLNENSSIRYSFGFLIIYFIGYYFFDHSLNSLSLLIIRLVTSVILLLIFIRIAKKDVEERTQLLNLSDDSMVTLEELSIITKISKRELKMSIFKKILSNDSTVKGQMNFNKCKALKELDIKI